ncbi:MAG TPA: hypothetical protein VGR71_13650 [Nitrospira sp.]|nr:hypothetical protein [Nitrospira sp.]
MMLVHDHPATLHSPKSDGQSKVQTCPLSLLGWLYALHMRNRERDVISCKNFQRFDIEYNRVGLAGVKQPPGFFVGGESSRLERRRHIKHSKLRRMARKNLWHIFSTDCSRPSLKQIPYSAFVPLVHLSLTSFSFLRNITSDLFEENIEIQDPSDPLRNALEQHRLLHLTSKIEIRRHRARVPRDKTPDMDRPCGSSD